MTYPSVISADNTRKVSPLPSVLDRLKLPDHIAVIMDGNGRWAKARGLPRSMGHTAGVEALKTTLHLCSDWGIGALTVYAFSTENWSRPNEEVNFLMIRRPPRSTPKPSSAASDVYKRQYLYLLQKGTSIQRLLAVIISTKISSCLLYTSPSPRD